MKVDPPTRGEEDEAKIWWSALPDYYKGHCSIWQLLAMYAAHWAKVHTVRFDSDEKVAEL